MLRGRADLLGQEEEVTDYFREQVKTLLIRRATVGDAAALQALNQQFNADETPLHWIEKRLSDAVPVERVFVATNSSEVIGFCCITVASSFCRERSRAEITELFVAGPHRRKGVAKELMKAAARHAGDAGVNEFFVLTNKMNKAARSFYESLGYAKANDTLYRRKAK